MLEGPTCVVAVGVVVLAYAIADRRQGGSLGLAARGVLVLLNAALNGLLLAWIIAPAVGLAGGIVNALAGLPFFSRDRRYQGVLGWMNWVLPMSWPVTGVGLVFALIDLAAYAAWGRGAARIDSISVDGRTGTVSIEGGVIRPWGARGFNMGNFTFLRPGCRRVIAHETGHALNLAAFGAIFHYTGAIDQSVPPFRRRFNAYAEHLAESHRTPADTPLPLRMWG